MSDFLVEVKVFGISYATKDFVFVPDFPGFCEEAEKLYRHLEGSVTIRSYYEHFFELNLEMRSHGNVRCWGKLASGMPGSGDSVQIRYEFETDQSYLSKSVEAMRRYLVLLRRASS